MKSFVCKCYYMFAIRLDILTFILRFQTAAANIEVKVAQLTCVDIAN